MNDVHCACETPVHVRPVTVYGISIPLRGTWKEERNG